MTSLIDYAKTEEIKTGYKAWRDKSPENQKAWKEGKTGFPLIDASMQLFN